MLTQFNLRFQIFDFSSYIKASEVCQRHVAQSSSTAVATSKRFMLTNEEHNNIVANTVDL